MKKDNTLGAIPASVRIDIGPKYRVHIDENDPSSIQKIKRIIDSGPVISQTELTSVATQIIIIRAKHAQDTKTEKETSQNENH